MQQSRGTRAAAANRVRRTAALAAARAASSLSRLGGHRGSALPGLVAEWIDPSILAGFRDRLNPVILVAGANGKTTTTRLAARIIERATGIRPISNRSGANLSQGIVTALIAERARIGAEIPAVFEVDEFALSRVASALRPDVVVMLNLLRDQLDRYGEIDTIARRWKGDIGRLPPATQLVICADDPRLESLAGSTDRRVRRFGLGLADDAAARPQTGGGAARLDPAPCPRCGERVDALSGSKTGLGPWRCPTCGLERTELDLSVRIDGVDASGWLLLTLADKAEMPPVRVRLSGGGGAYDSAAAVLAAIAAGIEPEAARWGIDGATPAFGRLEEIRVDDRLVVMTLAKNPASVAEAADAAAARRPEGLLIGLADRPADGRDTSWIWDAPLDPLLRLAPTTVTGNRAEDLALRFKYGMSGTQSTRPPSLIVDSAVEHALDGSLSRGPRGGTLMILATYTALLSIRRVLERRGVASAVPL
jgi:UDP-N-acetylmuramyl tripeptide synthase